MSKRKSKNKTPKARNWVIAHAKGLTGRKGAGFHSKRGYVRHGKHKGQADERR